MLQEAVVDDLVSRIGRECLRTMEDGSVSYEHKLMGALAFQRLQQLASMRKPRGSEEPKFDRSLLLFQKSLNMIHDKC